ncbi:NUDIX hydrolase [Metasolibacillus meyeri]|uniref:NUDIX hydrolase n=1 Tax=Metasolibacillus meyeri TaxID=1071052 RepID=UPI000D30DF9D|nr:NUDIX hydrolase [Metasolibacillus meyeri]
MKKWTTRSSEYVYQSNFGHLRKDECELPNSLLIQDYYVNEYADWVNAVVLTRDYQIVLVKQYRYAAEDFFLEVPAGKPEQDETLEEGILREICEETGYASNTLPIKLGEFFVNPATQTNKVATFLITDAYYASDQQLDDTEEIEVVLFDFDEFEKLLQENHINTQLFTVTAYYLAKSRLGR